MSIRAGAAGDIRGRHGAKKTSGHRAGLSRRIDVSWSRRNIAAALALCVVCSAGLTARMADRPHRVDGPIPLWGERIAAARERINPNTASVGSLRRLPGVGRIRAEAIAAYRREHGPEAFGRPEDLAKVHGIGPATVKGARPHLTFQPSRGTGR